MFRLLVLCVVLSLTEAKILMGQGRIEESWLKKHGARDQHRPWQDQKSRHYGGLSYFPTDNNNNGGNENKESKVENEQGSSPRPCVGLCYYKKLMDLERKTTSDKSPNETIQNEKKKEVQEKSCVGICQYYKSLGLENPYQKKQKKKQLKQFL